MTQNKILFFIVILLVFLLSCKDLLKKESRITIINKTDTHIDSLVVTNWIEEAKANRINRNDSMEFNLGFENNKVNGDGSYAISYFLNDKIHLEGFGYYSNGIPTNSTYKIEIYNDTLIIKEQMKN